MVRVLVPLLLFGFLATPALGQAPDGGPAAASEVAKEAAASKAPPAKLRVGISHFPPFVLLEEDTPRGYSLDLWREIAERLGVDYEYVNSDGVRDKLDKLQDGSVDVAIGGITLTRDREQRVDFTYPTYESGLGLLVRADGEGAGWFSRIVSALKRTKLGIVLGFLLLIVVAGHLVWLAERGESMFADKYIPGVFEGMYWAIVTASTVGYGDKAPVRWPGRVVAALVIIISLPMFALFTAELASAITVEDMTSSIESPADLGKRPVAIVTGTASAQWAAERDLTTVPFPKASQAYEALVDKRVDGVIYDAPSLGYFAQRSGQGRVRLAGEVFQPQALGMAVRDNSELREGINLVILQLLEEGELARLKTLWFGGS